MSNYMDQPGALDKREPETQPAPRGHDLLAKLEAAYCTCGRDRERELSKGVLPPSFITHTNWCDVKLLDRARNVLRDALSASSSVPSELPHTCDGGMNPPFPGECAACGRELWGATDIKALTERVAGFISAFMPQVERAESVEHRNAMNGVMWDLKTAIYLLSTARNALASSPVVPRSTNCTCPSVKDEDPRCPWHGSSPLPDLEDDRFGP